MNDKLNIRQDLIVGILIITFFSGVILDYLTIGDTITQGAFSDPYQQIIAVFLLLIFLFVLFISYKNMRLTFYLFLQIPFSVAILLLVLMNAMFLFGQNVWI